MAGPLKRPNPSPSTSRPRRPSSTTAPATGSTWTTTKLYESGTRRLNLATAIGFMSSGTPSRAPTRSPSLSATR